MSFRLVIGCSLIALLFLNNTYAIAGDSQSKKGTVTVTKKAEQANAECLVIKEIQPGQSLYDNESLIKVFMKNGQVKWFETPEANFGLELRSQGFGETLSIGGLPGRDLVVNTYNVGETPVIVNGSEKLFRAIYLIFGTWKVTVKDNSQQTAIDYVFTSDANTPLVFLLETGTGFKYLRGSGKVFLPDKSSVSLPCEKGPQEKSVKK